jgi:predicted PurR-regulated permease PerM
MRLAHIECPNGHVSAAAERGCVISQDRQVVPLAAQRRQTAAFSWDSHGTALAGVHFVPVARHLQSGRSSDRVVVTRARLSLLVLLTMTATGVGLCALVLSPFVPGLVWALALAIAAFPLHQFISRWVTIPSLAAAVSLLLVTVILLAPTLFVGWQIGMQAADQFDRVEGLLESGRLREALEGFPPAVRLYDSMAGNGGEAPQASELAAPAGVAAGTLQTLIDVLVQALVALFVLFFLFRDRRSVLDTARSLMPMSDRETDHFFEQMRSMTHATIYGTVVVSLIQGVLGGLMFAFVGIPGALLWGVAMAILSLIPSAGAFVIWMPVAVVLAAQGEWGKATLLGAWGALVVGTIDNLLYPLLVGKEMRLHTMPVFLAIVGGMFVFGAAGIVLGPVILSGTIALIEILRQRTARGRSAIEPR